MGNDYMADIIKNTKTASEQWIEFASKKKDIDQFKKLFHLRPTKSGVTIVSTNLGKPMRGIKVGRKVAKKHLENIYSEYNSSVDEDDFNNKLDDLKFQNRKISKDKINEEIVQAKMIREISGNQVLKNFLEVDELIFIASEFILHSSTDSDNLPRERVDIIAYDGENKIFLFELKTPDNKKDNPENQLKKYLKKYSEHKKQETISVLSEYPINCINNDKNIEFEAYAIINYSNAIDYENSKRATYQLGPGGVRKAYCPGVIIFN